MSKRLTIAILAGAGLGVFCIIGIGFRLGFASNGLFLASAWFNRIIMGLVIGLAGGLKISGGKLNWLWRGAGLGLLVSFAWFFDTGFRDFMGFMAGIGYGIIIDWLATRYGQTKI
ncbi:MAG: hypothetical protein MUC28_03110 [Planctomycetes bacterium]|jgi:hypothetical protein|nr:hypothetical protein [Planctomycetota bacterium]